MTKIETLRTLARKVVATHDPDDYKKWERAYEALHQEELEQVGGGIARCPPLVNM